MERVKLRDWPLLSIPRKVDAANLVEGSVYLYAADSFVSLTNHEMLVVDFYGIQSKEIYLRVFISDGGFASLKLQPAPKWSDSMIDGLLSYRLCAQQDGRLKRGCSPVNNKTSMIIKSFLKHKIKGEILTNPLDCIALYQAEIRKKALRDRHQRIKDQINSQFSMIEELPEDIQNWIEQYPLWEHQYIFYHRAADRKKIAGLCSACGGEVLLTTVKHNNEGVCPACGRRITFKSYGISHGTQDKFVFNFMQKGKNGGLIQRVFEGCKSYRDGYKEPKVSFSECRRYVFVGESESVSAYHYGRFRNTDEVRWCDGKQFAFGYMAYTDTGCVYATNLRSVIRNTKWMDSGIDLFALTKIEFDPYNYFTQYQKRNAIRYLVDNRLYSLIEEVVKSSWKGDVMDEGFFLALRNNKAYFADFREIGIRVDEVIMIESFGSRPPKKDVLLRIRSMDLVGEMPRILKYTTVDKALNYIEKFSGGAGGIAKDTLITWLDYLEMARGAGYDTGSSFVIFPKDPTAEHDRFATDRKAQENAAYDKAICEIFEKTNQMLTYGDGDLFIRPPMNAAEICGEAVGLRHCVDRYIADVALSHTMILFIRHKDKPLKPFFTVEFQNNKVRQCRGLCNVDATDDVKCFLKRWSAYIEQKAQ